MEAKIYVAQEDFEFRGVKRKKGDAFRITEEKASGLGDKVKLAGEGVVPTSAAPSSKPNTPSEPITPLPQTTMTKYTVKEAFETPAVEAVEAVAAVPASEGVEAVAAVEAVEAKAAIQHNVGDVVELTDERAAELGAKVEKVQEPAA